MWTEGKWQIQCQVLLHGLIKMQYATFACSQSVNYCLVFFSRSPESRRYSSKPISEPSPEATSEQDIQDSEDLAPLNLSTRNPEKSPPNHRLTGSFAEQVKREEVPLNLSLRASYDSAAPARSALSTSVELQQKQGTELDEEPCDQRQTAALALCQLAIASSVASSCDFSTTERSSEDCIEAGISSSAKKMKNATKAKPTSMKRSSSRQDENSCHKPIKRTKAPGRALRRRPRCS